MPSVQISRPFVLISGIGSLTFYLAGMWVMSLLLVVLSITLIYGQWRKSLPYHLWVGNPVRIIVPIFTASQLLYWLWFYILAPFRFFLDYDWMLINADFEQATQSCALYLLVHLIYFIFLHYGYSLLIKGQQNVKISLNTVRIEIVGLIVILISAVFLAGSLLSASIISQSKYFAYIGTNILRIFPVVIGLITFQVFQRETHGKIRHIGIIVLVSSLFIGGFLAFSSGMRFVLLEQLIIAGAVLHLVIKYEKRKELKKTFVVAVCLFTIIFILLTMNKFSYFSEGIDGLGEIASFHFERALQRVASFTPDLIVIDEHMRSQIFISKDITVFRIMEGLPLTTLLWPRPDHYQYGVEGLMYSVYKGMNVTGTSYFISAFTEFRVVFGTLIMILLVLGFGLFHGIVAAWSYRIVGQVQWIIVLSIFIMAGFWGINTNDLFEIPSRILFSTLIFYYVLNKMQSTGVT